jgi:hypothetical protein
VLVVATGDNGNDSEKCGCSTNLSPGTGRLARLVASAEWPLLPS